ncbi:MAG: hypothetical protein ACI87A_003499 [Planctomycetota bacterium]
MAETDNKASSGSEVLAPELMARVRQIQVRTHRMVSNMLSGAYKSTFRGTGIEFEEVRQYQAGDDVRTIDWNVTARMGEPYVKTFVEERQLTLQLVVDTSRSMDFGSADRSKREAAAEFCALMAYVAVFQHDQVGLSLFADEPGLHLNPKKGLSHVMRVIREVIAAKPGGSGSSLANVLEHQLKMLRRRSMIFVVSDFQSTSEEDWAGVLARLSAKHDVVCVRVGDPFEEELPKAGLITLRDIESGKLVDVDTRSAAVRAAWAQAAEVRGAKLDEDLMRARADRIDISTVGDIGEPVVRFFRRRVRRR